MPKRLLPEEKKRSVMVRLPPPIHQAYEAQARLQRRSLSALLVLVLEDCLEDHAHRLATCPTCQARVGASVGLVSLGGDAC